ncbi:SagB/ThcOx family dehydrogenase [Gudongella sp. DL1XJH-153]|uniref:SagB/ThcOx family dehydrogenase n=1 Tax=Gudongella sp. DL1XJH-153 TaxID=3409804 RepID=UPI003BB49FAF
MDKERLSKHRYFLKTTIREQIDITDNDKNNGISEPEVQKPIEENQLTFDLVPVEELDEISDMALVDAIKDRVTRRKYDPNHSMSLKELSWLLWSTQGVRKIAGTTVFRTVPSAGNRHPFETYIAIFNVEGLEQGIYRYLPIDHKLVLVKKHVDLREMVNEATKGQMFVGGGSVAFIWAAIPYRTEWRYTLAAHKSILLDAGHICQNLYLASEAIGYGTCAIGNYHQELADNLVDIDGIDEFVVYIAPVGK